MIQNKLSLGQLNAPLTLEHFYKGPKTRSRRAGLFGITGEGTLSTFLSPYLSTLRDC